MNHDKLLIATTNKAKLRELKEFFQPIPIEMVGLADVSVDSQPEETGATFAENAILKARFYHRATGLPTLADDGGFEIAALGGEPGVRSHRWVHGDRDASDEELISYTFERMKNVSEGERQARLALVLAFVCCDLVETASSSIDGVIPPAPADLRTPGFPYRSILYLPEIKKFYNEDVLTGEENARLNHRKKAVALFKPIIKKHLGI